MKKRAKVVSLTLLTVFCALSSPVGEVNATSTQERLNQAEQDKQNSEGKVNETQENLDDLKEEHSSLQVYLTSLNDKLTEASSQLATIENSIADKETEITETEAALAAAEEKEQKQYDAMKLRIKFMYERGDSAYMEMFFSSKNFSSFLNKSEYVDELSEYDRNMLVSYTDLKKQIAVQKEDLVTEREALEQLRVTAKEKKEEAEGLVTETAQNVEEYKSQISDEEQRLMEYEKKLADAQTDVAELKAKLAEEIALSRQSAMSVQRNLSDIQFSASDLDLMAAIIECEAGGESYEGKVAVGAVVINRVKSSVFPDTVMGVIYAPSQFSPVASGRMSVVLARGANESCYQAARDAMSGSSPVGDCVFFRTPIEGLTKIHIGGHIFY